MSYIAALMLIARSSGEPLDGIIRRQQLALPGFAALQLDLPLREPLRADDNLPWEPDQIERGEFRTGALVAIVVEDLAAGSLQLVVEIGASGVGRGVADLQV